MSARRPGFSLLELLVVITILTLIISFVSVRWAPPPRGQRTLDDSIRHAAARAARIEIGRDSTNARVIYAAAYPDGRVVTDSGATMQ